MGIVASLGSNTLSSPYHHNGGHLWVYLNWALGLRALGCRVIWLEWVPPFIPFRDLGERIKALKTRLEPYKLAESVALCFPNTESSTLTEATGCHDVEWAAQAD